MRCQLLGCDACAGTYCLGHAEASMAARLSPIMRDLRVSQPRNSLLHLYYAIRESSTLHHMCAHTRARVYIVRHSSVNDFRILSLCCQINSQFKSYMYTLSCSFAKMIIAEGPGRRYAVLRNVHKVLKLEVYVMSGKCLTSCSNVLYDAELQLRGLTTIGRGSGNVGKL